MLNINIANLAEVKHNLKHIVWLYLTKWLFPHFFFADYSLNLVKKAMISL